MALMVWMSMAYVALLSATTSNHVTAVTLTALVGTEVLLPCQITQSNSNLTQIQWKKGTENKSFALYNPKFGISVPDERYSSRVVFSSHSPLDGSILLKALEMEDQGMYTCVAKLSPPGRAEIVMNLTILDHGNGKLIIPCVTLGVVVFALSMFLIVLFIRRKCRPAAETYVNVPVQRKTIEQDSSDVNATYMGLNLAEQSVYSALQR
ncbi:nectin-1-like isoform X3 [Carcharodon carcharias]|uniref:nectin-1-like isoform X2 n=1 Tax=Carcharodon carcharias TaxID=13397 RepID=UPI001B7E0D11|nr:nectin-1-like isoform X2 [Carcharodon carcharias]XP_041032780.1 nectin-1-like isoform X3 [Carcharodon carcharias]